MSFRRSRAFLAAALVTFASPVLADPAEKTALSVEESRRRDAVEHYMRARLHAADSEYEAAIKEFKRAVELEPGDGALRREYADLLRELSVYGEAEKEARKATELSPDNPGGYRVLGLVLLGRANDRATLEEAAIALKKALDANPNDPTVAVPYAQTLLKLDRAPEAVTVLERVLDRAKGSAVALLYGEALEQSGQLEQAEALYMSIARAEPENRSAAIRLLGVYERQRRYDKAVPIVEAFLKAQPDNLSIRSEYGAILLRARRFPEASKVFQDILKVDPTHKDALRNSAILLSETRETDKADEVFRKLEALDPEDLDVPFRRAMNYLDAHRIPEAEKILLNLRQRVEKAKDQDQLAQVDGQLGYAAYLRKDYAEARRRLNPHLFRSGGISTQAFNLLLQIARDTEDWPEGLRIAREANARVKSSTTVRAALGEFLVRSTDPANKAEGAKVLEALASEGRPGALAAADAWQRIEDYSKAAAVARKALETYKEDPDLLFRLAASLEREKKITESVAAFEKLISVRSDHAQGLNYLGYLWADRGENLPRALELIQKAVDLDPSNGAYLDSLGWVYFQLDQLDKAEMHLKAAGELNPDDATIVDHLADVYARKGKIAEARVLWKKALTMKPDDGGKKIEEKLHRTENALAERPVQK